MGESRRSKWLLVVLIAAIAVTGLAVVACGESDVASGPEQTIQDMFDAMSAKDADAFVALMDPDGMELMEAAGITADTFKDMLGEEMSYDSMEFEGVKLQTEVSEDGQTATVTVVEGIMITVEDGEEMSDDIQETGEPQVYPLVLRDGKWYLDVAAM